MVSLTAAAAAQALSATQVQRLATVMLCSRETVMKMAARWPALADADVAQLLNRLISLKVPISGFNFDLLHL